MASERAHAVQAWGQHPFQGWLFATRLQCGSRLKRLRTTPAVTSGRHWACQQPGQQPVLSVRVATPSARLSSLTSLSGVTLTVSLLSGCLQWCRCP